MVWSRKPAARTLVFRSKELNEKKNKLLTPRGTRVVVLMEGMLASVTHFQSFIFPRNKAVSSRSRLP